MKLLYVGNVLNEKTIEDLNLSIAGKKYELALLDAINKRLSNNLSVISIGRQPLYKGFYNDVLFEDKEYKILYKSKYPVISDFILNLNFLFEAIKWSIVNRNQKKSVVVLNSPFGICLILLLQRLLTNTKVYSLTIDTPFIKENKFDSVFGIYNKFFFKLGHKLLKRFNGVILLNNNVKKVLGLQCPIHETRIGIDNNLIVNHSFDKSKEKFVVVFAGTLMKWKGIDLLLEAFTRLEKSKYELIVCGDGPLRSVVEDYAKNYSNISYLGRVSDETLAYQMSSSSLLVNITIVENENEQFGFPSKLVYYLASGRPVLSNIFLGLPSDLKNHMYVLDSIDPRSIAKSMEDIRIKPVDELIEKGNSAKTYVLDNYNYTRIVSDLLSFLNT